MLRPGEPVWHTLNYIDNKLAITVDVKPHRLDVCRRCACLGAYFAAQQMVDSQHLTSEITRQPETASTWSIFHWLSWVIVVTTLVLIILLAGCTETAKTIKEVTQYRIDCSALSDVNISMGQRQRFCQRFRKLTSLNDERKRHGRG